MQSIYLLELASTTQVSAIITSSPSGRRDYVAVSTFFCSVGRCILLHRVLGSVYHQFMDIRRFRMSDLFVPGITRFLQCYQIVARGYSKVSKLLFPTFRCT